MDFLNKAYAQVAELFRTMTPSARMTAGLLLVMLVVSLGYLFRSHSSGPDELLMGGRAFLPEQIPDMLGAFSQKGLTWKQEGNQIRIPSGQETKYLAALAEFNAMPQDYGDIMEAALQSGNSYTDTRDKIQERIKNAKLRQCSLILRGMSFVANALVHWDIDIKSGMLREKVYAATVSITPRGNVELSGEQVRAIRQGVACFVAGMKPENVTVINTTTGKTYAADENGMGSALSDAYAERKKLYEDSARANILNALSRIPKVNVSTFATLDPRRTRREHSIKHDPKPVPVQSTDKSFSKSQEGSTTMGRPGFTANQPQALQAATNKGSRQEEEKAETTTVNALSGSTQDIEYEGLILQKLTAAIDVPASYLEQIWRIQHPVDSNAKEPPKPPTTAELEPIRQQVMSMILDTVARLLPDVEGVTDKKELVTVTVFQDLPSPEIPAEPVTEQAMSWLGQSWRTLGLIVLVLISLGMLRSMIRSAPIHESKIFPVMPRREAEPDQQASAEAEAARRLQRFQTGTSLKDELTILVNEDPDAAANILRTWIGHPV